MDGRGRLAQSLPRIAPPPPWRARPSGHARAASGGHAGRRLRPAAGRSWAGRLLRRWSFVVFNWRVPSGAGLAPSGLFLLATLTYGAIIVDLTPLRLRASKDLRDATAKAPCVP